MHVLIFLLDLHLGGLFFGWFIVFWFCGCFNDLGLLEFAKLQLFLDVTQLFFEDCDLSGFQLWFLKALLKCFTVWLTVYELSLDWSFFRSVLLLDIANLLFQKSYFAF
jgi:hypothetical protein